MTPRSRLGSVAGLVLLAACGGGDVAPPPPPPPQAGNLTVNYFQNGPPIGAMMFTILGGPVLGVTAAPGRQLQVSFAALSNSFTRVIVTGALSTGDILTVQVPDVSLASIYQVNVEQVADFVTFSLIDTSLQQLSIHR